MLVYIKLCLFGYWGMMLGLNFIYVYLNWVIKVYDFDVIYFIGLGYGGLGLVVNIYLEGIYSEIYLEIVQDEDGLQWLFKQFFFFGGIFSYVLLDMLGLIYEGGELGYVLLYVFGVVFDNFDLLVVCVVGDGEVEIGLFVISWYLNKFFNLVYDGVVLFILYLNGYKIVGLIILVCILYDELEVLFCGYGYKFYFVEGDDLELMYQQMVVMFDIVIVEIKCIQ